MSGQDNPVHIVPTVTEETCRDECKENTIPEVIYWSILKKGHLYI